MNVMRKGKCCSPADDGGILGYAGAADTDRQDRKQRIQCCGLFDLIVQLVWSKLSETVAEAMNSLQC
ncbi:hypothetical protein BLNAU_21465 [Blattamonas nauphoetae]|uniref:Uncharacterized protein n=1 Tax=Blattamonas nauphoetae TaxID=2049346 RepID=A0ABQ9WWD5_9EUKA|nr:hypothetical protein BLNAU_21465 [Blattamonas nauphoetae]